MSVPPSPEPDPIPPEQARAILERAIVEALGEDWNHPTRGWSVVTNDAYSARLNKGRVNVDFFVNAYDGTVTAERGVVNGAQDLGRTFALVFFVLVSVLVVVAARALGYL